MRRRLGKRAGQVVSISSSVGRLFSSQSPDSYLRKRLHGGLAPVQATGSRPGLQAAGQASYGGLAPAKAGSGPGKRPITVCVMTASA